MSASYIHNVSCCYFFFFKQKTAYEMRISDWSSDVCSSDLLLRRMKAGVTVHGFRSGFRDWSAECTGYAHEVAEMALAHTIENKIGKRRVGKECVSPCKSRWSPYHKKKKK